MRSAPLMARDTTEPAKPESPRETERRTARFRSDPTRGQVGCRD